MYLFSSFNLTLATQTRFFFSLYFIHFFYEFFVIGFLFLYFHIFLCFLFFWSQNVISCAKPSNKHTTSHQQGLYSSKENEIEIDIEFYSECALFRRWLMAFVCNSTFNWREWGVLAFKRSERTKKNGNIFCQRILFVAVLILNKCLWCHCICAEINEPNSQNFGYEGKTPTPRLPHTNTNEFHLFFFPLLLCFALRWKIRMDYRPTTTTKTTRDRSDTRNSRETFDKNKWPKDELNDIQNKIEIHWFMLSKHHI